MEGNEENYIEQYREHVHTFMGQEHNREKTGAVIRDWRYLVDQYP